MVAATCGVLLLGFPVAFSLAGTALGFALLGAAFGAFDLRLLASLPLRYFGVMLNEVLVAVPLFVFMGVMLERSRLAEQLLETMGLLFGRLRGGLGLSVTDRRHAARRLDRHRRRDRGHDGPAVAAGDAQGGLRPEARLRHDLRLGHARPDHPALDRAGDPRRHPAGRQHPGAARQGQFRAGAGVGRRPVRRRAAARAAAWSAST